MTKIRKNTLKIDFFEKCEKSQIRKNTPGKSENHFFQLWGGGGSNSRISTHSLLILPNAKIVNFKICQQVTTMAFGSLPLQPPQFHDISNCLYKRKHRYMRTAKSHHSFFNSLTISTSLTFITRLLDIHFHILHPFSFIGHQCHQTYHHGHQSH